jgi:hypothetical protein
MVGGQREADVAVVLVEELLEVEAAPRSARSRRWRSSSDGHRTRDGGRRRGLLGWTSIPGSALAVVLLTPPSFAFFTAVKNERRQGA